MRFLHTADWHLGRAFHGSSQIDEQAAVLDHIVAVARDRAVDAVIVAGDVFDRALPPVDAVRLASEAFARLSELCPVVVISGNHDSVQRLGYGSEVFARAGLHLRTDLAAIGSPVMIGDVVIHPVPYLEPQLVAGPLECDQRTHASVMTAAMARVRSDLATRPAGTRSVVVAHAFVAGGEASASERDLAAGGTPSVPSSVFAGADYVALGHLHRPQRAGERGRYAGSPIAFSFSEAGQRKSLAIVELAGEPGSEAAVELVDYPVARPLANLRGTLEELLADPGAADAERAWVHATITDPSRPPELLERLRRRFPHAVHVVFEPEGDMPETAGTYTARVRGASDSELLTRFVTDVRGTEPGDAEADLLHQALEAVRITEAAA